MSLFGRPGRAPDERVIEEVLFCLLDEHLTGFTLKRRDPSFLHGGSARTEPTEEFFNVELSHGDLLIIQANIVAVCASPNGPSPTSSPTDERL